MFNSTSDPARKQCCRRDKCLNPLGSLLPATPEYFNRNKSTKDGLAKECKACRKAIGAKHYESDPDYWKRHNNRPDIRAKARIKDKKYRQNNPRKQADKQRDWRQQNREKALLSARHYRQVRRSKAKDLPHTFTPANWEQALVYWDHKCCVCGKSADMWTWLAQEHWQPQSKGGGYTADNIVPMCHSKPGVPAGTPSCNLSKFNKDPLEWLTERYGKRKGKTIYKRVMDYFDQIKGR